MRNRRFDYEETFPCGCAGGRVTCGVIGVNYMIFGNVEIGFSNKESRYKGNTKNPHVNLDYDQVKKLHAYLGDCLKKYDDEISENPIVKK